MPARLTVTALAALLALARPAAAGPTCAAGPAGDRFATCFDPGNRLALGGGVVVTDGGAAGAVTGELALRHRLDTDEPEIWWRLEHVVARTAWRPGALDATLYHGRFMRHARDGRVVLPTSPPRKIFLPFDLGAEATVGELSRRGDRLALGVVRSALLFDVLRSPSFRHRLAFGVAGRWDLSGTVVDRELDVAVHEVAPLTLGVAQLHLESRGGLTLLDLAVEGGRTWSSVEGWRSVVRGAARLERVLLAIDDRPVNAFAELAYPGDRDGATATVGLRLALLSRAAAPR